MDSGQTKGGGEVGQDWDRQGGKEDREAGEKGREGEEEDGDERKRRIRTEEEKMVKRIEKETKAKVGGGNDQTQTVESKQSRFFLSQ